MWSVEELTIHHQTQKVTVLNVKKQLSTAARTNGLDVKNSKFSDICINASSLCEGLLYMGYQSVFLGRRPGRSGRKKAIADEIDDAPPSDFQLFPNDLCESPEYEEPTHHQICFETETNDQSELSKYHPSQNPSTASPSVFPHPDLETILDTGTIKLVKNTSEDHRPETENGMPYWIFNENTNFQLLPQVDLPFQTPDGEHVKSSISNGNRIPCDLNGANQIASPSSNVVSTFQKSKPINLNSCEKFSIVHYENLSTPIAKSVFMIEAQEEDQRTVKLLGTGEGVDPHGQNDQLALSSAHSSDSAVKSLTSNREVNSKVKKSGNEIDKSNDILGEDPYKDVANVNSSQVNRVYNDEAETTSGGNSKNFLQRDGNGTSVLRPKSALFPSENMCNTVGSLVHVADGASDITFDLNNQSKENRVLLPKTQDMSPDSSVASSSSFHTTPDVSATELPSPTSQNTTCSTSSSGDCINTDSAVPGLPNSGTCESDMASLLSSPDEEKISVHETHHGEPSLWDCIQENKSGDVAPEGFAEVVKLKHNMNCKEYENSAINDTDCISLVTNVEELDEDSCKFQLRSEGDKPAISYKAYKIDSKTNEVTLAKAKIATYLPLMSSKDGLGRILDAADNNEEILMSPSLVREITESLMGSPLHILSEETVCHNKLELIQEGSLDRSTKPSEESLRDVQMSKEMRSNNTGQDNTKSDGAEINVQDKTECFSASNDVNICSPVNIEGKNNCDLGPRNVEKNSTGNIIQEYCSSGNSMRKDSFNQRQSDEMVQDFVHTRDVSVFEDLKPSGEQRDTCLKEKVDEALSHPTNRETKEVNDLNNTEDFLSKPEVLKDSKENGTHCHSSKQNGFQKSEVKDHGHESIPDGYMNPKPHSIICKDNIEMNDGKLEAMESKGLGCNTYTTLGRSTTEISTQTESNSVKTVEPAVRAGEMSEENEVYYDADAYISSTSEETSGKPHSLSVNRHSMDLGGISEEPAFQSSSNASWNSFEDHGDSVIMSELSSPASNLSYEPHDCRESLTIYLKTQGRGASRSGRAGVASRRWKSPTRDGGGIRSALAGQRKLTYLEPIGNRAEKEKVVSKSCPLTRPGTGLNQFQTVYTRGQQKPAHRAPGVGLNQLKTPSQHSPKHHASLQLNLLSPGGSTSSDDNSPYHRSTSHLSNTSDSSSGAYMVASYDDGSEWGEDSLLWNAESEESLASLSGELDYDVASFEVYADWMSELPHRLQDVPLISLAIPGSHISLAIERDLRPDMDISPCNYEMAEFLRKLPNLSLFNSFRNIVKKIWKAWMGKQMLSVTQQLYAGIRYFDIRVTKYRSALYAEHGLYSRQLPHYLKEIKLFLDSHPKEVLILHIGALNQINISDKRKFVTILFQIFGAKMAKCVKDVGEVTLKALWRRKKQVIIVFPDEDVALLNNHIFAGLIWSDTSVTTRQCDAHETKELADFLEIPTAKI